MDESHDTAKMDASLQSIANETTILDLNDDCLREVFEHMEPHFLSIVADVCTRFRQNAAQTARPKCINIYLSQNSDRTDYSTLRNFGASAKSISVRVYGQHRQMVHADFQRRLIELLGLYGAEKVIEVDFRSFTITDEIAFLMKPLLERLRKISFQQCHFHNVSVLENLSHSSPELREFSIWSCKVQNEDDGEMQFDFRSFQSWNIFLSRVWRD